MLIGTITKIVPTNGYESRQGWIFTFDMTIQNPEGTLVGEIGSKSQTYPLAVGQEITVEPQRTDHGTKFKKVNPQYSEGSQHSQHQKNEPDWDKIAEGKVLCNMISSAIQANQIKCPDIQTAKYLTGVVMGTEPQGGDPNPEYDENPHPIDEDDPIPF